MESGEVFFGAGAAGVAGAGATKTAGVGVTDSFGTDVAACGVVVAGFGCVALVASA